MSGPCECTNWQSLGQALTRRKTFNKNEMNQTRLARCLSLLDLTAIGIGCTLGAGIYVVAGTVAHQTAGPGVIVSFAVAGIASVMAGLCYAEFGARVPKTGSAYVYSYVAVGEFTAFVIGWNMMLEYVIGTASVASALSLYINSLAGGEIVSFYKAHTTIVFSSDFQVTVDILAFAFVMLLTAVLCIGVRESSLFNNFFTG
jgi:amino acid transporter